MSDQILVCPRCGHSVNANDWFCDACGLPLKRERLEHLDRYIGPELFNDDDNKGDDVQLTPRRRPSVKRRNIFKILTFSTLAVIVIGGYGVGKHYFSKEPTLNRIIADPTKRDNSVTTDGQALSTKQRQELDAKLKDHYNLAELHHRDQIGDAITYQKTGHQWMGFDRYQLVVNPLKIDTQKTVQQVHNSKSKPSPRAHSHSLSERQQVDDLFQQFWTGMNRLTANGSVRQNLARYFVGGKHNDTYQHLHQMAISYYHAGYDVKYQAEVQTVKGHDQATVQFDLIYSFYSSDQVHVQKFHWHADLIKYRRQYMIQSAIGDLEPFKDQVLDR